MQSHSSNVVVSISFWPSEGLPVDSLLLTTRSPHSVWAARQSRSVFRRQALAKYLTVFVPPLRAVHRELGYRRWEVNRGEYRRWEVTQASIDVGRSLAASMDVGRPLAVSDKDGGKFWKPCCSK